MVVQTDAGLVPGWRIDENQYRVRLNNPGVLDLHRKENCAYVELGNPGVPHGVKEVPYLTWQDRDSLREMARQLRFDPAFPKGANINLYTWLNPEEIRILTFERGVEDYTLACGTGCGSTAAVLWAQGKLSSGKLTAHNRGGILTVTVRGEGGQITAIELEGPTEVTAKYEL